MRTLLTAGMTPESATLLLLSVTYTPPLKLALNKSPRLTMFLAGSRRADSSLRPEVALTLNHFDPLEGPLGKTSTPNQLQIFTKGFAPATQPRDPPPLLQNPPPVYTSLPNDRSFEAGFSKRRPKHVPIVIPPAIINSVLKDLPLLYKHSEPVSPLTPRGSFRLPYDFEKEEIPVVTNSLPRPRHIPILIPAFAQPSGIFPPTPPGSGGSTPRASQTAPYSCNSLYTEMSRPTTSGSWTSTLDSNASAPSPNQMYAGRFKPSSSTYHADMNSSSESSLQDEFQHDVQSTTNTESTARPLRSGETTAPMEPLSVQNTTPPSTNGTTNLSGLVCNVHKCTGKEPHALVGATTTILGDKLYVFGGRVLSRRRPQLTSDLYELDLVRRHWTKVEATGDIPPARYFHSVCHLGDTKLICYGGMSPAPNPAHGKRRPRTASSNGRAT